MQYSCRSDYHHIAVEDHGMLRVLRFERNRQSSMYLDAPFDTDFEYPSYLHLGVAVKPGAERTLVIGLGGGSVVKRMWRDYPWMTVDVVELDPAVADIAHRYFALPEDERIRIHIGDGRAFVESSAEAWDLLVVDAFDEDVVPRPFLSEEFMRAARAHLAEDGAAAYNFIGYLTGDRSKAFRSLYRTLGNVWARVWVFLVDEGVATEGNNLVLVATDADISTDTLRARIADRVGGRVTVPAFETFGLDLVTEPIRTGDVPIIHDEPKRRPR